MREGRWMREMRGGGAKGGRRKDVSMREMREGRILEPDPTSATHEPPCGARATREYQDGICAELYFESLKILLCLQEQLAAQIIPNWTLVRDRRSY